MNHKERMVYAWKLYKKHKAGKTMSTKLKKLVFETLTYFPKKQISYVNNNVWFISNTIFPKGRMIQLNNKIKQIIILSEDITNLPKEEAKYIITHEISHATLNHKKSTKKTEKEAIDYANKILDEKNPL